MNNFFEIIIMLTVAVALIFGFTIFFRASSGGFSRRNRNRRPGSFGSSFDGVQTDDFSNISQASNEIGKSKPNENKVCPVCETKLTAYELVSSSAFPSFNGQDRFMHIRGCPHCLRGTKDRICPVCKKKISTDDILICRLFERKNKRIHVHVLGCTKCRATGS